MRLPHRAYERIEVEGSASFQGRWLAQYVDRVLGSRYSIGETPGGTFFVLCLDDADRHSTLQWFQDADAVCRSGLAVELKRAAKSRSGKSSAIVWTTGEAAPERTQHTIDPATGIRPIAEWGSECARAPAENVSHRLSMAIDISQPRRFRATCGATVVEIRRADMGRWYLFVRAGTGEFHRQRNFQTCFEDHAKRTAEAWYGPATDGWLVVATKGNGPPSSRERAQKGNPNQRYASSVPNNSEPPCFGPAEQAGSEPEPEELL